MRWRRTGREATRGISTTRFDSYCSDDGPLDETNVRGMGEESSIDADGSGDRCSIVTSGSQQMHISVNDGSTAALFSVR